MVGGLARRGDHRSSAQLGVPREVQILTLNKLAQTHIMEKRWEVVGESDLTPHGQ